MPQAVIDECTATPDAQGAAAIRAALGGERPGLTRIPESEIAALDPAYAQGLGSGEVAVLAYAAQHGHIALIDDHRARAHAQRLNIVTVGSGAVLLALKANGRIDSIAPALDAWQKHGYFVALEIVNELLRRAGEASNSYAPSIENSNQLFIVVKPSYGLGVHFVESRKSMSLTISPRIAAFSPKSCSGCFC